MSRRKFKDIIRFAAGYLLERPTIDEPTDHAAEGSRNVVFTGQAEPEPFKGLSLEGGIGGIHYSGPTGFTIAPVRTLTVASSNPSSGVTITVTTDIDGNGNGTT
jgi:hypothetical protein